MYTILDPQPADLHVFTVFRMERLELGAPDVRVTNLLLLETGKV